MATYNAIKVIAAWIFGPLTIAKIISDFGGWKSIVLMILMGMYWIVTIISKGIKEWDAHRRRRFDMEKDRYDFEKKSRITENRYKYLPAASQ